MTVEPKFVPSNNINITVSDDLKLNVRLVDCVGYALPSAKDTSTTMEQVAS